MKRHKENRKKRNIKQIQSLRSKKSGIISSSMVNGYRADPRYRDLPEEKIILMNLMRNGKYSEVRNVLMGEEVGEIETKSDRRWVISHCLEIDKVLLSAAPQKNLNFNANVNVLDMAKIIREETEGGN